MLFKIVYHVQFLFDLSFCSQKLFFSSHTVHFYIEKIPPLVFSIGMNFIREQCAFACDDFISLMKAVVIEVMEVIADNCSEIARLLRVFCMQCHRISISIDIVCFYR